VTLCAIYNIPQGICDFGLAMNAVSPFLCCGVLLAPLVFLASVLKPITDGVLRATEDAPQVISTTHDDIPVGTCFHLAYTDDPPADGRGKLVYNEGTGRMMYRLYGTDMWTHSTQSASTKWVYDK